MCKQMKGDNKIVCRSIEVFQSGFPSNSGNNYGSDNAAVRLCPDEDHQAAEAAERYSLYHHGNTNRPVLSESRPPSRNGLYRVSS